MGLVVVSLVVATEAQSRSGGPGAVVMGMVLDEDARSPIAGAVVYLAVQGRGPVSDVSRVLTDEKGRFIFTGVAPGSNYFLNAGKLGWFRGGYESGVGPSVFRLTAGQQLTVNILLTRTSAISGVVKDDVGEAVVGGEVRAFRRLFLGGDVLLVFASAAATDDRGTYRLGGLPAGTYYLFAAPATAASMRMEPGTTAPPTGFFPGVADLHDALPLEIAVGEDRKYVDFALPRVPGFAVAGRTVGERVPLGTRLYLFREPASRFGPELAWSSATVEADGAFRFAAIPSGRYTLVSSGAITTYFARSDSLVPQRRSPGAIDSLQPRWAGGVTSTAPGLVDYQAYGPPSEKLPPWIAGESVTVDSDVQDLRILVRQGAEASGEVVWESGQVVSETPSVYVEPADGHPLHGLQMAATSGSAFTIRGLLSGEYFLRVGRIPGQTVKSIVWNGQDLTSDAFDVSPGTDFRGIRVTLTRQVGEIAGNIASSPGVSRVVALLFPCGLATQPLQGLTSPVLRFARTVSGGAFRFADLPAGDYCVVAVDSKAAADWPSTAAVAALAPRATRIWLNWGEARTADLAVVGGR